MGKTITGFAALSRLVLPMGVEPITAILETAALPLSYGSAGRLGVTRFLEIFKSWPFSMGRKLQVIAPTKQGWLLTVREPPDESSAMRVRLPLRSPDSAAPLAHRHLRACAFAICVWPGTEPHP
jgi:hypothetical protein